MPDYKRSHYLCLMDAGVNIKFYKPCEALKPYVRYYYTLQCGIHASVLTFPLGSPQIIFHRKNPLFIPQLDSFQPEFTISGQVNFPAKTGSFIPIPSHSDGRRTRSTLPRPIAGRNYILYTPLIYLIYKKILGAIQLRGQFVSFKQFVN